MLAGLVRSGEISSPRDAVILYGEYGRPYVAGSGLEFSISHSGRIAACAFSRQTVGLDVQRVPERFSEGILTRFGIGEEYIKGKDPAELASLWCRLESCGKYTGRGLTGIDAGELIVSESRPACGREDIAFIELDMPDGYRGCVCAEKPVKLRQVWVTLPEILKLLSSSDQFVLDCTVKNPI